MGFSQWVDNLLGRGKDDSESDLTEEYGSPDAGEQYAETNPLPSLFGGVEPLTEGELGDHPHDPNP